MDLPPESQNKAPLARRFGCRFLLRRTAAVELITSDFDLGAQRRYQIVFWADMRRPKNSFRAAACERSECAAAARPKRQTPF
jgi:hypothetical protein